MPRRAITHKLQQMFILLTLNILKAGKNGTNNIVKPKQKQVSDTPIVWQKHAKECGILSSSINSLIRRKDILWVFASFYDFKLYILVL